MKKNVHLFVLTGLTAGILSCKAPAGSNNTDDKPVSVSVGQVIPENVIYYDSYPATITALKEVEIRGDVSGYVTGIFFTEGSVVRQGEKLYEIDRSRYMASYEEAKANVDIARANLDKVKQDYDRYIELSKQDAIAKQRLDYAKTDVQNATLQVDKALAEQTKAKTDLDYSLITAPFDGTIGISHVRLGTLITPGQTLMNVISSDDPMGVDLEIDEKEYGRFREMETRTSAPDDSTFRLVLPDNTLYSGSGKIGILDRAVNQQTGTIKVRIIFPNAGKRLIPGMNCKIKVMNATAGSRILIPLKAIVEQMGEFFVFLDRQGKAGQVKVALGKHVGDKVIVESGLVSGDQYILDGIQRLRDGSPISTNLQKSDNQKKGIK